MPSGNVTRGPDDQRFGAAKLTGTSKVPTALATGRSLGELVGEKWRGRIPRGVVGVLLAMLTTANVLQVTADLVAVGEGMRLLHAGPAWLWALVAGATVTGTVMLGSFETGSPASSRSSAWS